MHKEKVTKCCCVLAVLIMLSASLQNARSQQAKEDPKPRLYMVATSPMDSQWNWTVQETIREFVPNSFWTYIPVAASSGMRQYSQRPSACS